MPLRYSSGWDFSYLTRKDEQTDGAERKQSKSTVENPMPSCFLVEAGHFVLHTSIHVHCTGAYFFLNSKTYTHLRISKCFSDTYAIASAAPQPEC